MKLAKIIALLVVFVFTGCKTKKEEETKETKKPNVIIVITDDQGYGDIAAHGNKVIKTPNIDGFYSESYHLTDFHVNPTCAPTRSGLMTGRFANSTGVWHTVGGRSLLREDEKTMADMFTENGYKTGAFGKWHMGDNYPFRAHDRGFQETVMHYGGGVQQTPDYWGNDYFDDTYFKNGTPVKYQGYCTDVFFDEAIKFIQSNKEDPFFCYISTNAPHGPYNVPVNYYNMYKDLGDDVLADTQKRFYGMITNVDDNFGKLRSTLKELNIADNTILIFMTDNGTSSGYYDKNGKITGYNAEMRGTKGSEYEGGHRVPFFIHWKNGNINVSKDINELTAQIDILPTLAELCGLKLPKDHLEIHGESLVPMLGGTQSYNNRMLVTDSQRMEVPVKWKNCSVMQNKWRLINGAELYNIEDDKSQSNDIAAQYPERVEAMRRFYEEWWTRTSGKFNEQIFFKIGIEEENPVALTAHDVHSSKEDYPWNQLQIRKGNVGSGYWCIDVKNEGDYEISLRRYPEESDLLINTTVPKVTTEELPGLQFGIPEGVNLNFTEASIKIGDQISDRVKVTETDKSADFKVHLKPGRTELTANFLNAKGEENVAYYVYVKKM
ncbi:arylsulfatase [Flavivirga eckloniae]|uniref:N-acetylgalactosamine 6-sulfate sulfatase n=1 Tax=Flavivirga eckloniae TaxID=1803846 RepID=A0A2K9PX83_9FLAO|nr:arylsulfatase [Flavivirga eckloniae]AUP81676.1 N-acetylgalactosamine 6-sulfate sulfatase [Flavivirga eckloniae]